MKALIRISFLIFVMGFCLMQNVIPQKSVPDQKPLKKEFIADPQRATMLALTFPGFGQIYNRKYLKIPFVYAGFAGVVYFIGYNSNYYNIYMKAYQDFIDKVPDTDSYLDLEALKNVDPSTFDPVLYPATHSPATAQWYREGMLKQIDYYKKYRDLSYIGVALWYVITVLDANVDASLYNYDIIDNLDLMIIPTQLHTLNSPAFGVSVSMRVTF